MDISTAITIITKDYVRNLNLDKRTAHGDWASSPFSYPELLAYLMFVTILCYVLLFTVISLYLLSLLMNSYFNYCFHECYCTLCYMYLQVIQINIIIIIIIKPGQNYAFEVGQCISLPSTEVFKL